MTNQEIAQHLINEDIKYHKLVNHLAAMDVHIEFYPDIATAVQVLLAPDLTEAEQQNWTDRYVEVMGKAQSEAIPNSEELVHILV